MSKIVYKTSQVRGLLLSESLTKAELKRPFSAAIVFRVDRIKRIEIVSVSQLNHTENGQK